MGTEEEFTRRETEQAENHAAVTQPWVGLDEVVGTNCAGTAAVLVSVDGVFLQVRLRPDVLSAGQAVVEAAVLDALTDATGQLRRLTKASNSGDTHEMHEGLPGF